MGVGLDSITHDCHHRAVCDCQFASGGGGTRYRFADTGLDPNALRERSAPYQAYFDVESEPVR